MSDYYVGGGKGQCIAIKASDGERCTNGAIGHREGLCGTHKNADDPTTIFDEGETEYVLCEECGWQQTVRVPGEPPWCGCCGTHPGEDYELRRGMPVTDGGQPKNDSERPGRRCDYCGEHKEKTRVEKYGAIRCADCDEVNGGQEPVTDGGQAVDPLEAVDEVLFRSGRCHLPDEDGRPRCAGSDADMDAFTTRPATPEWVNTLCNSCDPRTDTDRGDADNSHWRNARDADPDDAFGSDADSADAASRYTPDNLGTYRVCAEERHNALKLKFSGAPLDHLGVDSGDVVDVASQPSSRTLVVGRGLDDDAGELEHLATYTVGQQQGLVQMHTPVLRAIGAAAGDVLVAVSDDGGGRRVRLILEADEGEQEVLQS